MNPTEVQVITWAGFVVMVASHAVTMTSGWTAFLSLIAAPGHADRAQREQPLVQLLQRNHVVFVVALDLLQQRPVAGLEVALANVFDHPARLRSFDLAATVSRQMGMRLPAA